MKAYRVVFATAVILGAFLASIILRPLEAMVTVDDDDEVMKVEESWKMTITDADATIGAPQFNTVMSPFPHVDSYYGLLNLNYRDLPEYVYGGVQAQMWKKNNNLDYKNSSKFGKLDTPGQTVISWTQELALNDDGTLTFTTKGSTSFWGQLPPAISVSTDLEDLDGYTSDISVKYTRLWGYERSRIDSLKIIRIKKYDVKGKLVGDDETPIVVLPY